MYFIRATTSTEEMVDHFGDLGLPEARVDLESAAAAQVVAHECLQFAFFIQCVFITHHAVSA